MINNSLLNENENQNQITKRKYKPRVPKVKVENKKTTKEDIDNEIEEKNVIESNISSSALVSDASPESPSSSFSGTPETSESGFIKISLYKFRCYENKVIHIEEGKVVKLNGNSEKGKSTIMEAIYWCFYGEKEHSVKPIGDQKKKTGTKVTIKFPGGNTYERSTDPDIVKITLHDGTVLENDSAEQYIDDCFGDKEVWVASGYLKQKEFHKLLFSSNKEKIDIIKSIALYVDDPQIYVENIQQETNIVLKDLEKQRNNKIVHEKLLNNYLSQLNVILSDSSIDEENFKKYLSEYMQDEEQNLHSQVQNNENNILNSSSILKSAFSLNAASDSLLNLSGILPWYVDNLDGGHISEKDLNILYHSFANDLAELRDIIKQIKKTQLSLIPFENDIVLNINMTETNITKLENDLIMFGHIIEKNKIENQLSLLQTRLDYSLNNQNKKSKQKAVVYTNKDIENVKNIWNGIELEKQKLSVFPLVYDQNIIKTEIEKTNEFIKLRKERSDYLNKLLEKKCKMNAEKIEIEKKSVLFAELQNKFNEINNILGDNYQESMELLIKDMSKMSLETQKEINSIKAQLQNLENNKKGSKCPSCSTYLCFNDKHQLEITDIPLTENEKNIMRKELQDKKKHNEEVLKTFMSSNSKKMKELEENKVKKLEIENKLNNLEAQINSYYEETEKANLFEKECEQVGLSCLDPNFDTIIKTEIGKYTKLIKEKQEKLNILHSVWFHTEPSHTVDEMIKVNEEFAEKQEKLKLDSLKKEIDVLNVQYITIQEILAPFNPSFDNKIKTEKMLTNLKINLHKYSEIEILKTKEKKFYELHPNITLEILEQRVKELKCISSAFRVIKEIKNENNQITNILQNIEKYERIVSKLGKAKDKILNLEHKMYEDVVNTINAYLNIVLKIIFEKGLSVKLCTFKETLKGKIKPKVGFIVTLNGQPFDIKPLCGGEKERISLGLLLALSQLNDNPFIILDETLASLDDDNRYLCSLALKKFQNLTQSKQKKKKTIIMANHGGSEGWYQQVIDV
jgi:DNA repair exonuclease SbcCD ATPase subunit